MDLVIINRSREYPIRRSYYTTKRILDLLLCFIALPVIIPVVLLCIILIALDSPGPVFFVQERVGKDGKPFKIYKFRTMKHNLDDTFHRAFMKAFVSGQMNDSDAQKATQAKVGDTQLAQNSADEETRGLHNAFRKIFLSSAMHEQEQEAELEQKVYKPFHASEVTRVGRFLRKTSLDELPQLWNVVKGQMSLVGPRPNVTWEVESYRPWHYERLEVLPGITGLAQVKGRSSISFDHIVQYDIEYVQARNLLLDLKILWWTVATVFLGVGVG